MDLRARFPDCPSLLWWVACGRFRRRDTMKRLKGSYRIGIIAAVLFLPVLALGAFQSPYDFEHGSIGYTSTPSSDAIAKLQARIDSGETRLQYDPEHGYLPALLGE